MEIALIFLAIIIIILVLLILYLSAYSKLSQLDCKIKMSEDNIKKALKEKHEIMKELEVQIKKACKKKDYLKDFNEIEKHNLNSHDLDNELSKAFETMISIKNDHKSLKTDDFDNKIYQIRKLDQNITANKNFFNKNNNELIKSLKGYYKLVGKYSNIKVKNSYEIKKEPSDLKL